MCGTPLCIEMSKYVRVGMGLVQGMKVALELWKVLQEDPRWWGVDGELAPTKFNPDRCDSPDQKQVRGFQDSRVV